MNTGCLINIGWISIISGWQSICRRHRWFARIDSNSLCRRCFVRIPFVCVVVVCGMHIADLFVTVWYVDRSRSAIVL